MRIGQDANGDGIQDAYQIDADRDGVIDTADANVNGVAKGVDSDSDGVVDAFDPDSRENLLSGLGQLTLKPSHTAIFNTQMIAGSGGVITGDGADGDEHGHLHG